VRFIVEPQELESTGSRREAHDESHMRKKVTPVWGTRDYSKFPGARQWRGKREVQAPGD